MPRLSPGHLVVACAAIVSLQAHAGSALFTGYAHGSESVDFKLTAPDLTTVLAQGATSAGGFLMGYNGAPSFEAYCVDLFQHISFGVTYKARNTRTWSSRRSPSPKPMPCSWGASAPSDSSLAVAAQARLWAARNDKI